LGGWIGAQEDQVLAAAFVSRGLLDLGGQALRGVLRVGGQAASALARWATRAQAQRAVQAASPTAVAPAPTQAPLPFAGIDPSQGFPSYQAYRHAYGPAGSGFAWHHIVEQTPNAGNFPAQILHNPGNIIPLPHGAGSIHARISGYYSSIQPFTGGQTVRQWLSTQPFNEQYQFGIQVIKDFGGARYLLPQLR
jgi:hypothetical protein